MTIEVINFIIHAKGNLLVLMILIAIDQHLMKDQRKECLVTTISVNMVTPS